VAFGLEFDVYLMGGQSNMQGVGRPSALTTAQLNQPDVWLYHSTSVGSTSNANKWITMRPAGWPGITNGYGPEITFAERLRELEPDRNIAVIKHAEGGTSLAVDWQPVSPVGTQYSQFKSTVLTALNKLTAEGHTYTIRGMLWQQGEEDTTWGPGHLHPTGGDMSGDYGENLGQLIDEVRNLVGTPDMPFVYGNVLPHADPIFPYRDVVRQQELYVDEDSGNALSVTGAHMVSTDAFTTHSDSVDGFRDWDNFHYDEQGLIGLGRAYAESIHAAHVIPEPSTACSLLLGGGLFCASWAKRRRSASR
jgi:hypothetical protein